LSHRYCYLPLSWWKSWNWFECAVGGVRLESWKVHWSRWWDFWTFTFKLLQFTEIIYITNKCNQWVICLSFIPFVRLFMRNIQTAVSSHPLKIGHMFIWTYLLGIVHTTTS
jgi:hypothetical protein